ncbi:MAG: T9SS type A sorting domain-containing protein [Bacteroidota bacterium]
MRTTLFLTLLCLLVQPVFGQQYGHHLDWLNAVTDDTFINDVALDADELVYIVGSGLDNIDFDGPTITGQGGEASVDGATMFFAAYSPDGQLVMSRIISASIFSEGYGIAIGKSGDIYVAGIVRGIADFDGPNSTDKGGEVLTEKPELFIARYTASNNLVWVTTTNTFEGDGFQYPDASDYEDRIKLEVSLQGNVYVSAEYLQEGPVDFDGPHTKGQGGEIHLNIDSFVAKYDAQGALLWVNHILTETAYSGIVDLDVNHNDEVFIVGGFDARIDLDGLETNAQGGELITPQHKMFLAKYDVNGILQWATTPTGASTKGFGVEITPKGNIYAAGNFKGSVDFDGPFTTGQGGELVSTGAYRDYFLARYQPNGVLDWVNLIDTKSTCCDESRGPDIATGFSGVYAIGQFEREVDFDGPKAHGDGSRFFIPDAQSSFIAKYNHAGDFLWAKPGTSAGNYSRASSISVFGSDEHIAMTGHFVESFSFEGSTITGTPGAPQFWDYFVAKLNPNVFGQAPQPPYSIKPFTFFEAESHVFIHPEDIVASLVDSQGDEMPVESAIFTAVTADEELQHELLIDGCQFLGLPALLDEETNGHVYTIHMAATDRYGVTGEWQVPVHIIREGMEEAEQDETVFEAVVCSENETGQAQSSKDQLHLTRHAGLDPVSRKEPTLTAYPNPFNPQTTLSLSLPVAQHVRVAVYDMLGRQVALIHDGLLDANQSHSFTFDAAKLPSGAYLVRVQGEGFVQSRRISLVK